MTTTANPRAPVAPGPGHWQADTTHFTRPCTRLYTELQPEPFRRGFEHFCARYGLLLDHLACEWVDGVAYTSPRPVADAEVPARVEAAARAFETRVWRDDVRRWEEHDKPASIRAHLALQRVDPSGLPADALLEHVERCCEHLQAMIEQHHRYNGAGFLPVADFLVQAVEWTGASQGESLAAVAGWAPASRGDSDELARFVATLERDPAARALVEDDGLDPASALEGLTALETEVGAAAREYLELVGHRLLDGLDLTEPYALERPDVLVRAIRTWLAEGDPAGRARAAAESAARALRARVPAAERERFDELLAEARHACPLRDERGLYSDVWAVGLLRRALLAAGARLVEAGAIERAEQLLEAGRGEIRALLERRGGPSAGELAARARDRATRRTTDAPPTLGDPPPPPPPLDALPAPARRAMTALMTFLGALFADSDAAHEGAVVRGLGASAGSYEGVARLVEGPASLDRLRAGDVLVTQSTSEAFNVALPLLGAIVTDRGGVLSHAAIVARECAIPAVVGSRDATSLIPDGARVRVDGSAGEVTILG